MSLTLGLIVRFHEKQKKKRKTGAKEKQQKYGKQAREREREQENENVKRNVMGKNVPQHTFMRNRKLANRFLFSLQQHGKQAGKGIGLRMGGGKWIRWAARERNVVTEAAAFEHLAWLSLCAVLFLFLLANQLADWLNEKLHCECEYECECHERGQRMK